MKSFINTVFSILEGIGRAKAATYYSRMGRHDIAKEIMLKN
jgi:hypothetical protein